MKIERVQATLLKVPYPLPFEAAWEPGVIRNDRDVTVVRIQADSGLVGWGASGFDQADDINSLAAPHLVGEDAFAFERHARITRYAKGAWIVEMALCDLVGKAAGLPLAKLWGHYADRIPAYASIVAAKSPAERADDALALLERGYRGDQAAGPRAQHLGRRRNGRESPRRGRRPDGDHGRCQPGRRRLRADQASRRPDRVGLRPGAGHRAGLRTAGRLLARGTAAPL